MPIYVYKCTECGLEKECIVQSSALGDNNRYCPNCDKVSLKRQLTAANFKIK